MSYLRYQTPLFATPTINRLASFQDEIDQLFGLASSLGSAGASAWVPPLDLYDDESAFVVTVELPGLAKEDIALNLREGVLTVSGERKPASDSTRAVRTERPVGKFERSIALPAQVNSSAVSASYKDGLLCVTLPKSEEAKPRQIEVNIS